MVLQGNIRNNFGFMCVELQGTIECAYVVYARQVRACGGAYKVPFAVIKVKNGPFTGDATFCWFRV